MKVEFLKAIDTVCKMSDIDLRISDIKECKVQKESEEVFDNVFLHCRNDKEMFEFNMNVTMTPLYFEITVTEVKGSPYSCDDMHITLDRNYNVVFTK